ncbi:hypothetical protein SRHO_G00171940 [Serrasalmus rhombeus]
MDLRSWNHGAALGLKISDGSVSDSLCCRCCIFAVEANWIAAVKDSLRKETNPNVKRTIQILSVSSRSWSPSGLLYFKRGIYREPKHMSSKAARVCQSPSTKVCHGRQRPQGSQCCTESVSTLYNIAVLVSCSLGNILS